jgi:hypothetical protein
MPRRIRDWFTANWMDYFIVISLFSYVVLLLVTNLRSLVPYLKIEQPESLGITSGQIFFENILFLPQRLAQYLQFKLYQPEIFDFRLVSAAIGLFACIALFMLINKWHTRRLAFATVLLFASSSLFLHMSRLSLPDAGYLLAVPLLLLIGTWLRRVGDIKKLPLGTLFITLLLYLPGLWLFILIGVLSLRKRLRAAWKLNSTLFKSLTLGIFVVFSAPLAYSLFANPDQAILWLGLPELSTISLTALGGNFLGIFEALFLSGIDNGVFWLAGSAVLDVFTIAMVVLGIYAYHIGFHPLRKRAIYTFALISLVLAGLGGMAGLGLVLPIVYILAANGIAFLLQQWFTVFPKNPVARSIGIVLISVVIVLTCAYHVKRYFVAWPRTPATISQFENQKL